MPTALRCCIVTVSTTTHSEAIARGHHVVMPGNAAPASPKQQVVCVSTALTPAAQIGVMSAAFIAGVGVATDDPRAARRVCHVIAAITDRRTVRR